MDVRRGKIEASQDGREEWRGSDIVECLWDREKSENARVSLRSPTPYGVWSRSKEVLRTITLARRTWDLVSTSYLVRTNFRYDS